MKLGVERSQDPSMFWKINETKYLLLSNIVKIYLTCTIFSVASERDFKVVFNISGGKRIRLLPENIEMILFLKYHLRATENC